MGSKHLFSRPVFLLQTIHDKNTEIISQTEDKGRKDDIHNIELRTSHCHQPQDDHPADSHRSKSHQRQFDPSVRD